jgi:HAD superfamily hydrolase (TIGR01509 family)
MISFVYFDVGGVIISDFSTTNKWDELINELKMPTDRVDEFVEFWNTYEEELCLSRHLETLVPLIEEQFKIGIPEDYSLLHDGIISKLEKNESIIPVIKEINKKSKIGLLTNMYVGMLDALFEQELIPDFQWDVTIDSSIVHVRKPNRKVYEIAEKEAQVHSNEILFIDNSIKKIKGAQEMGWQTFHYDATNPKKASQDLMEVWTKIK